jgi:hypothetical protein
MVKVLAAVADFERELIVERTQAGQACARAEGKHRGRPSKTKDWTASSSVVGKTTFILAGWTGDECRCSVRHGWMPGERSGRCGQVSWSPARLPVVQAGVPGGLVPCPRTCVCNSIVITSS